VINAPIFGGFLGMRVSGASLDDRALDIIAVEYLSVRRLLQAAAQPILGISRPIPGIHTLHVANLTVHTSTPLDLALDGELIGTIPADFQVAGDALRVVTPKNSRTSTTTPTTVAPAGKRVHGGQQDRVVIIPASAW